MYIFTAGWHNWALGHKKADFHPDLCQESYELAASHWMANFEIPKQGGNSQVEKLRKMNGAEFCHCGTA